MKKFTIYAVSIGLIYSVSACFDTSVNDPTASNAPNGAREKVPVRQCASMDVLAVQLRDNPRLQRTLDDIEERTSRFSLQSLANPSMLSTGPLSGVLTIPVAIL